MMLEDPFEHLDREDFLQALDPHNWQEEVQLGTPTFAARLAEGRLLLAKGERQLELAPQEVQALMRFLADHVTLFWREPMKTTSNVRPTSSDEEGGA
jgi:hypothetical protein